MSSKKLNYNINFFNNLTNIETNTDSNDDNNKKLSNLDSNDDKVDIGNFNEIVKKENIECYIEDITNKINTELIGTDSVYDIYLDDTEKNTFLYLIITSYNYSAVKKIQKIVDSSEIIVFYDSNELGRRYGIKLKKKEFVILLKKIGFESLDSKKCYKKLLYSDQIKHYSDYLFYNGGNLIFFDFN